MLTEFGPKPEPAAWKSFSERVFFAGGGFNTDSPGSLLDVLSKARNSLGAEAQLVHYLAVPPVAFTELTKALGQHGLAKEARAVYEKPFGTSQKSFEALDRVVHSVLDEQQVYRIDHFLGKEATQDLHVLRFANELFAAMWNRKHVESVQIDVPEKLGITDRAGFYDATGAVLDMLVTHLFQVAAEVAMEPPATLGPLDLQSAREEVISCFRPLDPSEVVLGQFDGYRDVPGIAAGSTRDTYVAARLWIDNDRWRGVPFYLRTGKRLAATEQQVSLILREPSGPLAGQLPADTNVLSFSLAGNGEIGLSLMAKKPGPDTRPGERADLDPAREPEGRGPAAALRPADPRRAAGRPLAVHPPGRPGRGVGCGRTAAGQPAPGRAVRAGVVGAGRGPRPHRPGTLAARPVSGLAGDRDRTAQGDAGQYPQGGRRNPHAAVADRMAEDRRVRPAVQADGSRAAAEAAQRVRVHAQRENQRTVGRMPGRHRGQQESPPGGCGRARRAHSHGPRPQPAAPVEHGHPVSRQAYLYPVSRVSSLQPAAAQEDPACRAVRPGRQQHPVPSRP